MDWRILIKKSVVEKKKDLRDRRGMRKKRKLEKKEWEIVGIKKFGKKLIEKDWNGLKDKKELKKKRNVLNKGEMMRERIGDCKMEVKEKWMGSGEKLLSRNIGIEGDEVIGSGWKEMKLMKIGKKESKIGERKIEVERDEWIEVKEKSECEKRRIMRRKGKDRIIKIEKRGGKDRIGKFEGREIIRIEGKEENGKIRVGVGKDIKVDVEKGDILKRGMVGERIGEVGEWEIEWIMSGKKNWIIRRYRKKGREEGIGFRNELIEKVWGKVEDIIGGIGIKGKSYRIIGEERSKKKR